VGFPDLTTGADTFSSSMEVAANYNRWIVDRFSAYSGKAILEIGIGHGGFRRFFPNAERYTGIDIDAEMVQRAQAAYPRDTFVTADAGAPGLPERVGTTFDTALCVNVLEHIPDDRAAATNMAACLRPGGHLLLFVPAFPRLYNDLDRLAGHVRRYTKKSVAAALPDTVDVLTMSYFNPIGALGWWANNLMRHSSLESGNVKSQVGFFDRWVVPVSRRIDPLTRSVFGQSVVCVARKKK